MLTVTPLPLYNDASFSYSVTLSNVSVNLVFTYNNRSQHFHLTATLRDGTVLLEGRKIVPRYNIFSTEMFEAGVTGSFYLFPTDDATTESEATTKLWVNYYLFGYIE